MNINLQDGHENNIPTNTGAAFDNKDKAWWKYKVTDMEDKGHIEALNGRATRFQNDMRRFYNTSRILNNYYEEVMTDDYSENHIKLSKSWNLLRVAVDAHFNMVAKFNPKVSYLTKGANIKTSQMATKADEWILHLFNYSSIYEQARDAFKDSLVSNLGVMKIDMDTENKSFKFKRLLPDSFAVEKPYEGSSERKEFLEFGMYSYHDIEDMINDSNMDKPKKDKILKQLQSHHGVSDNNQSDLIKMFHLYRIGKRRAMFTDKMIIECAEWKYDWFPYIFFVWDKKKSGVVGTGPAELTVPAQKKIQALLYRIDKNIELFSNHYMLLPRNSEIGKIDNEFGNCFEINMTQPGSKPVHVTPPVIHEQVFSHLENTYAKGLKVARVSDLQGDGRVPVGLNQGSGVALQHYNTIDNSKFVASVKLYEKTFLQAAKICLEWGCDNFKDEKPFKSLYDNKKEFMNSVNIFASNLLPETPAGRFDALSQLMQMQVITREEFFALLDAPDIVSHTRSVTDRINAAKKILEEKLYDNKACMPDPIIGYAEQKSIAASIYAKMLYESDIGVNDPALASTRSFLENIKAEEERIKQQQLAAITQGVQPGADIPMPQQPTVNESKIAMGGPNRPK